MAGAELGLNGDKQWLATVYRIDVCYAGGVKNAQGVIKWSRESLPTEPVEECEGRSGNCCVIVQKFWQLPTLGNR
jgi:hypothetical protein